MIYMLFSLIMVLIVLEAVQMVFLLLVYINSQPESRKVPRKVKKAQKKLASEEMRQAKEMLEFIDGYEVDYE